MKRAYDLRGADRLIPLLRSIQREIRERSDAARSLRIQLANVPSDQRRGDAAVAMQAALAHHRQELRLATRELARLGCAIDDVDPHRVRIPGESGELEDGYTWSYGEARVSALVGEPDDWSTTDRAA